jgi:hypothetical protein
MFLRKVAKHILLTLKRKLRLKVFEAQILKNIPREREEIT